MPASRRAAACVALLSCVVTGLLTCAPAAHADDVTDPPARAVPADNAAPAASTLPLREGAAGALVRLLHERLTWLGYDIAAADRRDERMGASTVAAVQEFQEKFGMTGTGTVGTGTWSRLRLLAGQVGRLPAPCRDETSVCIDKTTRLVRFVENGEPVLTMDARFGIAGDETGEGTFRVVRKSRDHVSSRYRTWMPYALFFHGGEAVHYSPYFARDGYNGGSHGCVNVRDFRGARWLFAHTPVGTRVHVYRS